MKTRFVVQPRFFRDADAMRVLYDKHFSDPYHLGANHFVWHYWYVPRLYTYLRAHPASLFPKTLLARFMRRLRVWAIEELGLSGVGMPAVSVYVNGFEQRFHNDARNGRWAYVFSLTRWSERAFEGGETLLGDRLLDYFFSERVDQATAGRNVFTAIPARFNQLLVFDDRLIHGVAEVRGTHDPRNARVVLHGHIEEDGVIVKGPLSRRKAETLVQETLTTLATKMGGMLDDVSGVLPIRLDIHTDGVVKRAWAVRSTLVSRVRNRDVTGEIERGSLKALSAIRFPRNRGSVQVTIPINIG
jgi:hypothetical protein